MASIFAALLLAGPVRAAEAAEGTAAGPLTVFAPASLQTSLDVVAAQWRRAKGQVLRVSYAGTPALARQVEQGAPADVFLSADVDWMAYLAERGLVRGPRTLLGNRLVLVAPRDSPVNLKLEAGAPLAAALGDGRLAVANVESVPAGRYARRALESVGLWAEVADRLVQTADVRAALRLVARGEAPLGIVYLTDARADPAVRAVAAFADDKQTPIAYRVAAVTASKHPQADAFVDFLFSPAARGVFKRDGFTIPATEE